MLPKFYHEFLLPCVKVIPAYQLYYPLLLPSSSPPPPLLLPPSSLLSIPSSLLLSLFPLPPFPLSLTDLGDTDAILHEFDTVLYDRATPDNLFGLIDASSLLWRLNLMGIDPGEKRWGRVTDSFIKFIGNHRLAW